MIMFICISCSERHTVWMSWEEYFEDTSECTWIGIG